MCKDDRADHRHQQDQSRDLEGEEVAAIEQLPECYDVRDLGCRDLLASKRRTSFPRKLGNNHFAKEHERPRIKAAVVDGRLFDDAAVKKLAALPSREVLLSQVLGTFIAPMTQFLAAIEATIALPAVMADVLERERQKAS